MWLSRLNSAQSWTRNSICFVLVLVHAFAAIGLPAPRTVQGVPVCESHGCRCGATSYSADGCCCTSTSPIQLERQISSRNSKTIKPIAISSGSCCSSKPTTKSGLLVAWEASKCRFPGVDGCISHAPTVRPYEPFAQIRDALTVEVHIRQPVPTMISERPPVPPPNFI